MSDKPVAAAAQKVMTVTVRRQLSSQSQTFKALNTYQKGDLFCIYQVDGTVKKIPMAAIFDIDETYSAVEPVEPPKE